MPWGYAAAAVVGVYGAKKSSDAMEDAANTSAESSANISDQTLALQEKLADQQRADFQPWRDIGEQALNQIWGGVQSGAFNVNQSDIQLDPSYQFRMGEGIEALDKSAASRGRLLSGAQNKAITNYAQDLASTEYGNAYNRALEEKNRNYNMLSGLNQGGQSSAAGQAQAASNLSSQSSNTLSNLSTSLSNSAYNAGQARANGYAGQATAINQGIENWMIYQGVNG